MKLKRYYTWAFTTLLVFSMSLQILVLVPKASAATVSVSNLTLTALNSANILVSFNYSGTQRQIVLTDSNVLDSNYKYEKVGNAQDGCHGDLVIAKHRPDTYKTAVNEIRDDVLSTMDRYNNDEISADSAYSSLLTHQRTRVGLLDNHAVSVLDLDFKPTENGACVEIANADGGAEGAHRIANPLNLLALWTRPDDQTLIPVDGNEDYAFVKNDSNNLFSRISEDGQDCRDFASVSSGSARAFEIRGGDNDYMRPSIVESNAPGCEIVAANNFSGTFFTSGNDEGWWIHHYREFRFALGGTVYAQPAPGEPGDPTGGGVAPTATDIQESCENRGGDLAFLICPIIRIADKIVLALNSQIEDLLFVPNTYLEGQGIEDTSARLRNLAYLILVPIMLIMVIGTAMGFEFVSAYTVKRSMPRLFIAALFITVSFPALKFLNEITNNVGNGIFGFLTGLVSDDLVALDSIFTSAGTGDILMGSLLAVIGAGAAIAIGSVGIFFSYALVAIIAILIGFFLLALRQMLVILLIIVAPLAILSWIFPGNDRLWKLWWGSLSKLLLLFPLIMMLIAGGRIFAFVVNDSGIGGIMGTGLKLVGIFAPYFFIPAAFKFAGGTFATLTGAVNNRARGLFDRQRNYRGKKAAQNWQDTRSFQRFKGGSALSRRASNILGYGSNINKLGANPAKWKPSQVRGRMGEARSSASLAQADAMLNDDTYASWKNNDDLNMYASRSRNEADLRTMLRGSGMYDGPEGARNMERDIARVEGMRKKYGNNAFRQATWQQAVAGGTAFSGADAWAAAADVAGSDNAVLASLVARGRSAAMSAGRVDQGGAGFMDTMRVAQQFRDNPDYTEDQATMDMARHVVNSQGANVLAHASMKPAAVDNLIPEMQRRLNDAYATGDQTNLDRELAYAASVYDNLAQTAPQLADRYAAGVMQFRPGDPVGGAEGPRVPDSQTTTVQRWVESRRNSEAFQATRREYTSAIERDATQGRRPPEDPGAGPQNNPTERPH